MTQPAPPADPTPAPAPAPPADPPADPKPDPSTDDAAKLKTALDKERQLRRDAEKRAREGDAATAKLAELEAASQSDIEKAVAAARKEGAGEAIASANQRVILAEARALAAEADFRNPQLAVRAIDIGDVSVTAEGTVDTGAITAALKALAEAEPYLLKASEPPGPRTPKPDPSQGPKPPVSTSDAAKGEAEAARRFGPRT